MTDDTAVNGTKGVASGIREHMEVIGADSVHIGTVDKVEGAHLKLTRDDRNAGGQHHYVPIGMVDGVEGDKVRMSFVAELAPQFWMPGDDQGHTPAQEP